MLKKYETLLYIQYLNTKLNMSNQHMDHTRLAGSNRFNNWFCSLNCCCFCCISEHRKMCKLWARGTLCYFCLVAQLSHRLDGSGDRETGEKKICLCFYPGSSCKVRAQMISRFKIHGGQFSCWEFCIKPCLFPICSAIQVYRELNDREVVRLIPNENGGTKSIRKTNYNDYCSHDTYRRTHNVVSTDTMFNTGGGTKIIYAGGNENMRQNIVAGMNAIIPGDQKMRGGDAPPRYQTNAPAGQPKLKQPKLPPRKK